MRVSLRITTTLLAGLLLLCLGGAKLCRAEEPATTGVDDQQIADFFRSLEAAFRNKRAPDVMAKLHKNFSYLMTYCTDNSFSVVDNTIETYRANIGSFFMNNPEVVEFTINVEHIEPVGKQIAVVARINSVVLLNNIRNTCETYSNYTLRGEGDRLLIRNVRGDATCSNTSSDEGQP